MHHPSSQDALPAACAGRIARRLARIAGEELERPQCGEPVLPRPEESAYLDDLELLPFGERDQHLTFSDVGGADARPLRAFRLVDQVGLVGSVAARGCAGRGRGRRCAGTRWSRRGSRRAAGRRSGTGRGRSRGRGRRSCSRRRCRPHACPRRPVGAPAVVVPAALQVVPVAAPIVCRHEQRRRVQVRRRHGRVVRGDRVGDLVTSS